MLNADDPQTFYSLRALREIVTKYRRPVVLWVGAGASRWAGYPSWKDVARGLRLDFLKFVAGFDNTLASKLIQSQKFPDFFQVCKELDRARYYGYLSRTFAPSQPTDTYLRFSDLLLKLPRLQIVTTNVDEMLERTIPSPTVMQNTDLTRIVELFNEGRPFIGKLHGSCSSIESTVFASSDYELLVKNEPFITALRHIFTQCSILFLGYGVRDHYVLELISRNATEMKLFGPGPHFVVTNEAHANIPGIRKIGYSIKVHPDHRAALNVLDFLHESEQLTCLGDAGAFQVQDKEPSAPLQEHRVTKTVYFISDFKPPGTWHTSQTVQAEHPSGDKVEITIGLGFVDDEIPQGDPFRASTALHDLVVGLTCFDFVYLPILAVAPALTSLGEDIFREIVKSDSLRFLHPLHQPAVVFGEGMPEPFGSVVSVTPRNKEGIAPQTPLELIRRSLTPVSGKEAEGEALISDLEERCIVVGDFEWELPTEVRGSLLMPRVATLLGIGDAILPSQVPRWLTFPYLRMAHLVHTGMMCASLGIQAAKVPFGGATLINGAFGVRITDELAEQCASYVLAGNYNTDLGAMVHQDLRVFRSILRFRDSQEGELLRREVASVLSSSSGAEFAASVDAGIRRAVSSPLLQKARDKFSFLLTNSTRAIPTPAVWGNVWHSDRAVSFWRAKSRTTLVQLSRSRGIGKDDPCICGSGEKLRLCCMQPLRD